MFRSRFVAARGCLFVCQGCWAAGARCARRADDHRRADDQIGFFELPSHGGAGVSPVVTAETSDTPPVRFGLGRSVAVLCAMLALPLGCAKQEKPIEHYQVARTAESPPRPAGHGAATPIGQTGTTAEKTRMLAALIPRGEQTWFFKLTGPANAVDPLTNSFRGFIRSIRFPADAPGAPTWTLPEGWRQDPPAGMRYATLRFGSEQRPLSMSVIPLQSSGDPKTYALSNINRWRNQLGLPPIAAERLDAETESIELPGGKAIMVRLLGTYRGDGMGRFRGPMAGRLPAGHPATGAGNVPATGLRQANPPGITYDAPKMWAVGKAGGMRKAAFQIAAGDQKAEVTAIDLAAAAGALLPNVNRWRSQIHLGEVTEAQLNDALAPIEIDGRTGQYVRLVGPAGAQPREAILGVILVDAGRAWFFKMKGNAELVEQQRKNFESFVHSIKFATR